MSESCPLLTLAQIKTDSVEGAEDRKQKEIDVRISAGMPILLAQIRLVDDDMNTVPPGAAGEVVARTPYLTQGYLHNPDAGAALWRGGWMHTGDIGKFDDDGYLHLVDRQKDVIKSGGEWISSIELENLISQHQAVREVAVIGVTDAKWGERPLAIVVSKTPDGVNEDDLKAHLKTFAKAGTISPYSVPERWKFVAELDKTSVGKIDKKRLRQLYGDAS